MSDTHSAATTTGEGDRGRTDSEREGLLNALQAERQERQALARQVAELQGKVATAATAAAAPKVYTEAEIQAAVNKGTITEARGNEIRARQIREEAVTEAKKAAQAELSATQTKAAIDAETARYVAALPAIDKLGTPERDKVEKSFARLVARGYDKDDPKTSLTAIEMAFGPVEALEAARPRGERETHEETGGGSGSGSGGKDGGGWPSDMPAKNRAYYDGMLAKKAGGYKDKADCIAEWKGAQRGRAA